MGIERCFYFFFFLVAESTLLGSLVPSNATLPSKSLMKQIMADPKKFVAEVSKVDPTELQNIITLLEGLLETSEAQEQDLVNKVDDETTKTLQSAEVAQVAQAAVEDAQADVEHAQAAVEDAQAALALKEQEHQAAQAALALKEQEHQAASDAHDAQEGAKAVAEQELADLEGGLNSEQEVIRQVIEMLQELQGSAPTQAPTTAPTYGGACTNPGDFAVGDGTGGSERYLGSVSSIQGCLNLIAASSYPHGKGITVSPPVLQGRSGACYVELTLTGHNGSSSWRTCAFEFDINA